MDNDMRIQIPYVSKHHARLHYQPSTQRFILTNLSENHTAIFGRPPLRVNETVVLQHGDVIIIHKRPLRILYPEQAPTNLLEDMSFGTSIEKGMTSPIAPKSTKKASLRQSVLSQRTPIKQPFGLTSSSALNTTLTTGTPAAAATSTKKAVKKLNNVSEKSDEQEDKLETPVKDVHVSAAAVAEEETTAPSTTPSRRSMRARSVSLSQENEENKIIQSSKKQLPKTPTSSIIPSIAATSSPSLHRAGTPRQSITKQTKKAVSKTMSPVPEATSPVSNTFTAASAAADVDVQSKKEEENVEIEEKKEEENVGIEKQEEMTETMLAKETPVTSRRRTMSHRTPKTVAHPPTTTTLPFTTLHETPQPSSSSSLRGGHLLHPSHSVGRHPTTTTGAVDSFKKMPFSSSGAAAIQTTPEVNPNAPVMPMQHVFTTPTLSEPNQSQHTFNDSSAVSTQATTTPSVEPTVVHHQVDQEEKEEKENDEDAYSVAALHEIHGDEPPTPSIQKMIPVSIDAAAIPNTQVDDDDVIMTDNTQEETNDMDPMTMPMTPLRLGTQEMPLTQNDQEEKIIHHHFSDVPLMETDVDVADLTSLPFEKEEIHREEQIYQEEIYEEEIYREIENSQKEKASQEEKDSQEEKEEIYQEEEKEEEDDDEMMMSPEPLPVPYPTQATPVSSQSNMEKEEKLEENEERDGFGQSQSTILSNATDFLSPARSMAPPPPSALKKHPHHQSSTAISAATPMKHAHFDTIVHDDSINNNEEEEKVNVNKTPYRSVQNVVQLGRTPIVAQAQTKKSAATVLPNIATTSTTSTTTANEKSTEPKTPVRLQKEEKAQATPPITSTKKRVASRISHLTETPLLSYASKMAEDIIARAFLPSTPQPSMHEEEQAEKKASSSSSLPKMSTPPSARSGTFSSKKLLSSHQKDFMTQEDANEDEDEDAEDNGDETMSPSHTTHQDSTGHVTPLVASPVQT